MDQTTEKRFEQHFQSIIETAAERYGTAVEPVEKLGSFESAVYDLTLDGHPCILKAIATAHRTPDLIDAELHWVNYLADNGVAICRAYASLNGNLVESVAFDDESGDPFLVHLILFEKARGAILSPETASDNLIRNWGQTIGRMHALTSEYQPPDGLKRYHWYDDPNLVPVPKLIDEQPRVVERLNQIMTSLKALPTDKRRYGLVHLDLHYGNFFVENEQIMVFDTDDCQYDFFMNDLSMPLYYYFKSKQLGNHSVDKARHFFERLLEGYRREFELDKNDLTHIPLFLKLREVLLYIIIVAQGIADSDPWCRAFMDGRQELIEKNAPVIDFDFSTLKL